MNCLALDLGGVVLNICHTWPEAMAVAGVTAPHPIQGHSLNDFPGIHSFQKESISEAEYLSDLSAFLGGISDDEALRVHQAILKDEIPGMHDLVSEVKEWGWSVGILSNTNRPHIEYLRNSDRLPIGKLFDGFITSYEARANKPEVEIFRYFEAAMGVSSEQIVFFDDYEENVTGAQAAGWMAFRVDPDGVTSAAQIRRILAELRPSK